MIQQIIGNENTNFSNVTYCIGKPKWPFFSSNSIFISEKAVQCLIMVYLTEFFANIKKNKLFIY